MATIVAGFCKRISISLVQKGCPAVNNSLRNWFFSRGIKKIPNKPRRRDGHHMNTYKLYWEDRLKNAAKPPLWIEPQTSIVAPSANVVSPKKSSGRFSLLEKRVAGVAVVSMLIAVVSFKMVFGYQNKKSPAKQEAPQIAAT
eukprot:Seg841.19 transcript_id=Seg841.19/GoldUCD/mRNA.D3Y31 product="hypothetical protein" protein_id=Seg841.19/GoldUCD/D3Y31